jgi:hypothetical protein
MEVITKCHAPVSVLPSRDLIYALGMRLGMRPVLDAVEKRKFICLLLEWNLNSSIVQTTV